jgi:tripartite-type tricarboxylate transporter receptor subunit TctC
MEKRWRHPRSLLRATLGKPAMKLSFRKVLHLMAGVSVLAAVPISLTADLAWSQATRTIKIVVPFPPGGGVDIVARLVADQIGRAQRTSVVVENRPGAGTLIATEAVARAAPDGNTICSWRTRLSSMRGCGRVPTTL